MLRRHVRLAVIVASLIALAALLPSATSAQGDGDTTTMQVGAVLCQDTDCIDHSNLVPGLTITASDSATGDTLATCTADTAAPHTCLLALPAGADWTLDWDQTPDGYTWRGDLYPVADGPFGSATLIPFVPVQAAEPTVAPTAPIVIEEPGHITVQAGLCTDATCHEITEFLDGFTISAVDPDTGEQFSSCATGNTQQGLERQCILDVPHDSNVALTWDDSQVPAGYVPFGDPFEVGDPAVLTLGFVPAAQPTAAPAIATTPAPITTLPTTGAGPNDAGIGLMAWVALALTGTLLAALAFARRLRPATR